MIPDFLKTKGFLYSFDYVMPDTTRIGCSMAFAPGANQGALHSPLPNYVTSNRPAFLNTFNLGGAAGTPIAGFDELMLLVTNHNPGGTGFPVVVQFGWRGIPNLTETIYEMAHDRAPASAEASAITAGATSSLGVAMGVRRYVPDVAEWGPIEIASGRKFYLPVSGPFLVVGAATIGGAAAADQVVTVHIVPRTIGVPRGS